MRVFNLPDLGEGLQEAAIVEWHVKPGDALEADQPMVSVETDKAIVEVPAPFAGKVEKLFGAPGDKIHVGAPLVGFDDHDAERDPTDQAVSQRKVLWKRRDTRPVLAHQRAARTDTSGQVVVLRRINSIDA